MPDQRSRRDIKQVHVLVYTTLENPGELGVQNLLKIFCRRVFSVGIYCNLSAATLYECERNLRNNFFPHRSSFDKLQLTHEQVRIIKHDVREGEIIKIVAFAGEIFFCRHLNTWLCNRLTGSELFWLAILTSNLGPHCLVCLRLSKLYTQNDVYLKDIREFLNFRSLCAKNIIIM